MIYGNHINTDQSVTGLEISSWACIQRPMQEMESAASEGLGKIQAVRPR
jgi:hypothetical protein